MQSNFSPRVKEFGDNLPARLQLFTDQAVLMTGKLEQPTFYLEINTLEYCKGFTALKKISHDERIGIDLWELEFVTSPPVWLRDKHPFCYVSRLNLDYPQSYISRIRVTLCANFDATLRNIGEFRLMILPDSATKWYDYYTVNYSPDLYTGQGIIDHGMTHPIDNRNRRSQNIFRQALESIAEVPKSVDLIGTLDVLLPTPPPGRLHLIGY